MDELGQRGVPVEVAPGIYSLWQKMGAYVRAYLIDTPDGLLLIDTLYDTDARQIFALIKWLGYSPADLRHIILTHAHRSHLGGLRVLQESSGAPVYAHEWESDLISGDRAAQQVSWRPQPAFRTYVYQVANNLHLTRHPPVNVDHFIHEGDRIGPLQVLHTPGHSPGHLAFYWPERRALFTGDAIVTWPRFELGWPGFLLNKRAHQQSLRRMAELDVEVLCTGHGEPVLSGAASRVRAALPQ
jgi:glyoxylase-like metal-dependent hydrolase (beta-lactamase superfamily II)